MCVIITSNPPLARLRAFHAPMRGISPPAYKIFRKQVSETAAGIKQQSDFSKGSVSANILSLALPLTVAQLINVLYNVVDRIYIGHIPGASSAALTGVGVTFPILSIVIAFANLFGTGAHRFSPSHGPGRRRPRRRYYGQHLYHAAGHRPCAHGAGARVQKTAAVSVRRQ